MVEHPGAVAVAAVDGQGRLAMVRQYRHPARQELDELPAGKLEREEDPLAAAKRELQEETGQVAQTWELLADFFTTPGFSDERMRLYLARDLHQGEMHLDDDEELEAFWVDLQEAATAALAGRYRDAKTIAGILLAQGRLASQLGRGAKGSKGGEQPCRN
ncbi:MAG: NUDIX hydrolase [Symbiobacteriia bacterium]